jgi:hypothetical protein
MSMAWDCGARSRTKRSSGSSDSWVTARLTIIRIGKGRFKDNSDKMRSGSIYDVADVLKSLTFLAKSKSLSFREKRMLDRAKFLIISEVSEVVRESAPDVEARVDRALERCFTTKARAAVAAPRKTESKSPAPRAQANASPRRAARA